MRRHISVAIAALTCLAFFPSCIYSQALAAQDPAHGKRRQNQARQTGQSFVQSSQTSGRSHQIQQPVRQQYNSQFQTDRRSKQHVPTDITFGGARSKNKGTSTTFAQPIDSGSRTKQKQSRSTSAVIPQPTAFETRTKLKKIEVPGAFTTQPIEIEKRSKQKKTDLPPGAFTTQPIEIEKRSKQKKTDLPPGAFTTQPIDTTAGTGKEKIDRKSSESRDKLSSLVRHRKSLDKASPFPVVAVPSPTSDQQNKARVARQNLERHLMPVPLQEAPKNIASVKQNQIRHYTNNYRVDFNHRRVDINRHNSYCHRVPRHQYPHWFRYNPNWYYCKGFTLGAVSFLLNWLFWDWQPYYGPTPGGFVCAADYVPTPWIFMPSQSRWIQPGVYTYADNVLPNAYRGVISVEVIEPVTIYTTNSFTGIKQTQVINVPYLYNAFYYEELGRWAYVNRQGYFVILNTPGTESAQVVYVNETETRVGFVDWNSLMQRTEFANRFSSEADMKQSILEYASANQPPLIFDKKCLIAGGTDITETVADRLKSPQTTAQPAGERANWARVSRDILITSWPAAREAAAKLNEEQAELKKFVAACNEEFDRQRDAGADDGTLSALKAQIQSQIDARGAAHKANARILEMKLENGLCLAFSQAAKKHGVGYIVDSEFVVADIPEFTESMKAILTDTTAVDHAPMMANNELKLANIQVERVYDEFAPQGLSAAEKARKLREVAESIRTERNFLAVVDGRALLFGGEDITHFVVERLQQIASEKN